MPMQLCSPAHPFRKLPNLLNFLDQYIQGEAKRLRQLDLSADIKISTQQKMTFGRLMVQGQATMRTLKHYKKHAMTFACR